MHPLIGDFLFNDNDVPPGSWVNGNADDPAALKLREGERRKKRIDTDLYNAAPELLIINY